MYVLPFIFPRSLLRGCSPLQHPIVILRETSAADLEAILEFVYHGEVSVEEAQLESFLRSARVLQISGLTETRCGYLHTIYFLLRQFLDLWE